MNLSIAVLSAGKPYATRCLNQCREWANELGVQLVVAGDGERGYALAKQYADVAIPVEITNGLGESAIPIIAAACHTDWVLRFDDDETGTPALLEWLKQEVWEQNGVGVYHFPRAWLWGDEQHFITSAPLWTDKQARLTRRELLAGWGNHVHAGAPASAGIDVPAAMLHYKLLVRSFSERQETARLYDALEPGAGSGNYFGKFTLPELFYANGVQVREIGDGTVGLDEWIGTGETVTCSRKTGRDSTLIGKSGWGNSGGNHVTA